MNDRSNLPEAPSSTSSFFDTGVTTPASYLDRDFHSKYDVLADHVANIEASISSLPTLSERSESVRQQVRQRISEQNIARSRFLLTGARKVYRTLTNDFREHLTIVELCARGANTFPALLPNASQVAAEQALPLDKREGRELTLALFVSAFLRDHDCGRHLLASMRRPGRQAEDKLLEYTKRGTLHLGSVTIERRGGAAIITLQNGNCLNAEDLELLTQLELAIDIALLSEDTRVGLIRGGVMTHPKYCGRRVFCAGINLRDLHRGQIPVVEYLLSREMGLIEKIRRGLSLSQNSRDEAFRYEKPWIGVIDGFAIGGGFQMVLNFDRVIAADDVYFSLPAAHEGIIPGTANFRLARQVGSKLARRIILSGERIYADSEYGKLVCDEVVRAAAIDDAIDRAIDELSGDAVVANRHMLNISDEPEDALLAYLAEFCTVQAERALSNDVLAKVKNW